MKTPSFESAAFCFKTLSLLALGLLITGCAAPSNTTLQPKPGSGIAEYRQIAREAHRSVAATVNSLEDLAREPAGNSKTLEKFDHTMHQLELTSLKTRARAEAIIARGQSYFEEWKEQMGASTNQAAARGDTERYARLHARFEKIRECSGEVRAEFRPFMMKLREFRAALDKPASGPGSTSSRTAAELGTDGRRVLATLAAVSKALDEAEAELRAGLARKR